MGNYAELLDRVLAFIRSRGRVKAEELAKWAEGEGIGPLTLSVIVNDLLSAGKLRGRGPKIELGMFTLPIPSELEAAEERAPQELVLEVEERKEPSKPSEEAKPEAPEASELLRPVVAPSRRLPPSPRKPATKPKRPVRGGLLAFIEQPQPEREERPERPEEAKPEEVEVIVEERQPPAEAAEERPPVTKISEGAEEAAVAQEAAAEKTPPELEGLDEDLRKAIEYLNLYHSVGELRFLMDLKAIGVKEPRKVMYRLIDLGYIVRKPLGVIDATDKLPRVKPRKLPLELSAFI